MRLGSKRKLVSLGVMTPSTAITAVTASYTTQKEGQTIPTLLTEIFLLRKKGILFDPSSNVT